MRMVRLLGALAVIASIALVDDGLHAQVVDRPAARPATPAPRSAPQKAQPAPPAAQTPANAQPPAATTGTTTPQAPSAPAWTSQCSSAARGSAAECVVSQTAFLTQTGQLLASVSVRLPANTKQPVMMVHVPVGLFLPAGIGIQIDEGKVEALVVQTCDLKGCYAGTPISPEMLAAMKSGQRFAVSFKNLNQQTITIPLTLAQFAEAYGNIQ